MLQEHTSLYVEAKRLTTDAEADMIDTAPVVIKLPIHTENGQGCFVCSIDEVQRRLAKPFLPFLDRPQHDAT